LLFELGHKLGVALERIIGAWPAFFSLPDILRQAVASVRIAQENVAGSPFRLFADPFLFFPVSPCLIKFMKLCLARAFVLFRPFILIAESPVELLRDYAFFRSTLWTAWPTM